MRCVLLPLAAALFLVEVYCAVIRRAWRESWVLTTLLFLLVWLSCCLLSGIPAR